MLVKDELLDKVVARIREQMPEDQAPQVEEFARQYYEWVDASLVTTTKSSMRTPPTFGS